MPKKDYDYINKLTEYFLNNTKKFWSDDPHDVKVRSWLQQHYPRFIQYAYDNTPEDIRKTISPQKLGREFQREKYMKDFEKRRQEGSNLALATIGRGVLAGAAAPLVAPIVGAGSVAEAGLSAAGLAGRFVGTAVGARLGRKADRYFADSGYDTSNSLFGQMTSIDGSDSIGPLETFGGIVGWGLPNSVIKSPVVSNFRTLRKYNRWLDNGYSNADMRDVANNVIRFSNDQLNKFYYINAPSEPSPIPTPLINNTGIAPDMLRGGIRGRLMVNPGSYTPSTGEINISRIPFTKPYDALGYVFKRADLGRLKSFAKNVLAHEVGHAMNERGVELFADNSDMFFNPRQFLNTALPWQTLQPRLSSRSFDGYNYGPSRKGFEFIQLAPDNSGNIVKSKIDLSPFWKGIKNGKSKWRSSPEEFTSEMRYMQQKLGDWNSFENMSKENQGKIVNYLSERFGFDKNYTFNLAESLGRNGYASGGKIHIKPENRGKFTALKKRTGHSASWFKAHGTPAQKKMAVFALNARKWSHKHDLGGSLSNSILYDYLQEQGNPMGDILLVQPEKPVQPVKISGDAPEPVYMPMSKPMPQPIQQQKTFTPTEVTDRLKRVAASAAALSHLKKTLPVDYIRNYRNTMNTDTPAEYTPSEDLIQYLISTENFLERPDNSLDGKWTIGYGDTDKKLNDYYLKNKDKKYTRAEAEKRLRDRVANEFLPELKKSVPNWDRLTPAQKDSLLSYAYNAGKYFVSTHKNFASAMRDFDLARAASELNAGWNQKDKKGRIMTGIRKRRLQEQYAFTHPDTVCFGQAKADGGLLDRLDKAYEGDAQAMLEAVRKARNSKL